MPFRVSYFINQQSSKLAGWSLNFWNLASDRSAALAAAAALAPKINTMLGAQPYVQSYRVSAYPADRLPSNILTGYHPGISVTAGNDADYPTSAIQFILRGAPSYRALVWLSGIPDAVVAQSGKYIPTPSFTGYLNAVISDLVNPANGWALNVLNRAIAKKAVTNLVTATGVLRVPAHGWGPEGTITRIRVMGFSKPKVANKVWRVTVIDADSVQLNFWTGLADPVIAGNNPQAQQQLYTQVPIASAEPGIASKHNRGRPIGLLGGRRRRRTT